MNYPLQYGNIRGEIDVKITTLLSRGDLYLRQDTVDFEKDFAAFVGTKHGVSTNSCTDSMMLSLRALGIGKGDEVITVGHTYISTIAAIIHNGATPMLIDIGEDSNMDADLLEGAITQRTKAILPVHLNGRCCDMGRIMKIANAHGLAVVEDAAQAVGAKFNGRMAGSFGSTGCFSFYPAKVLGCYGDAGFISTDDQRLATQLYLLRDNGEMPKYLMKTRGEYLYRTVYLFGFNSVMDNIQAGVLNIKLKYLPRYILNRRLNAKLYGELLSGVGDLVLPPKPEEEPYFDVFQNYVVMTPRRDYLAEFLEENGIETLVSWRIPNHRQDHLGLGHFRLPVTEKVSREVISLPMYPELTEEQIAYVADAIKRFFREVSP